MTVSPNNTLGKYRILREIARSNDIVYEAVDPAMGRRIAIKELLLPHHLAGAQKRERIERFYREAKAAGTLSHPNIVTIYEVGEENGRHFIAMEYLEGQSMRDKLQMQGVITLPETLDIALQLCDALGYAHSRGIVHRDIKPDNVHLLPGGVVKLTDFGIARITADPSITSQGQVFGTPSYMSPEQVASHTVDQRTDLFSLGVTLYEMLSGRKPFVGDSVITITYNIMNSQPQMPAGVPPSLQGVLQRALAKDPNQRYQNAAAMAADLRGEKYLADSQPGSDTAYPAAAHTSGTLETGSVPAEISGIPVSPGSPGLGPAGPYTPPPGYPFPRSEQVNSGSGMTPQARSFLNLFWSILAVTVVLVLVIWGINAAYLSYQEQNKRVAAAHLAAAGALAYNQGDYQTAAQDFAAARKLAPNAPETAHATQSLSAAQTARGQQALQNGDPATAQTDYQQAIETDNKNAIAFLSLGNLRSQQRDWNGALEAWQQAAQADPTSAAAAEARDDATRLCFSLAQQYASSNVNLERDYLQKVIEIDPGSANATQAQNLLNNLSTPGAGSDNGAGSSPNFGNGNSFGTNSGNP